MIEEKIYSAWAYSENMKEKIQINKKIYNEIKDKAEVKLDRLGRGYKVYKVLSNPHGLTERELALICDEGDLCFGYRARNNEIIIYTD